MRFTHSVGSENVYEVPGKYYYETDEFPNPRPTQPEKKKRQKKGRLGHFFPQQIISAWVGIGFVYGRKQTTRIDDASLGVRFTVTLPIVGKSAIMNT